MYTCICICNCIYIYIYTYVYVYDPAKADGGEFVYMNGFPVGFERGGLYYARGLKQTNK